MNRIPNELKRCIDDCLACYQTCTATLMGQCLESGGRHTEPEHARLMATCADLCRTAAQSMLSQASVHGIVCGACAEVCERCASSCESVGDMDECVRICRTCAESCRAMAAMGPASGRHGTSKQTATPRGSH